MNTTHNDCLSTKEKGIPTNSYPYAYALKEALNALCGMNDVKTRIRIVDVIFNEPATIVFWNDGSKTVVKAQNGETFDPEKGLALAILKRIRGNKSCYNNEFKKWLKNYRPEISEANSETRNEVKAEHSQNSLKARNDRNEETGSGEK